MANNRLFLMHKPTGLALYLGKRMGHEWYSNHDLPKETLNAFFDRCDIDPDDFAVAMEDATAAPSATDAWEYTDEGGVIRGLRLDKARLK